MHNRFFKSLSELKAALANFFGKFVEPNEEISSLCLFDFTKKHHSSVKQSWVGMKHKEKLKKHYNHTDTETDEYLKTPELVEGNG